MEKDPNKEDGIELTFSFSAEESKRRYDKFMQSLFSGTEKIVFGTLGDIQSGRGFRQVYDLTPPPKQETIDVPFEEVKPKQLPPSEQ